MFIVKNNRYYWQNDKIKLELSNPSLEEINNRLKIDDISEALYYNYTLKIYKAEIFYGKNDEEIKIWKLIASRSTYDFPGLEDLRWMLNEVLKPTNLNECEQHKHLNNIIYSKHFKSEGFCNDDIYEITKYMDEKGNIKEIIFYCGCAIDVQGDKDSIGIRFYLDTKDIETLLEWIEEFFKYSVYKYNKYMDNLLSINSKNKKGIGGNLYIYNIENNRISNSLENIVSIGDVVNIVIKKEDCTEEIKNKIIEFVGSNYIVVNDSGKILISDIIYISNVVSDDKLYYNTEEIKEDFMEIIGDYDIDLFKKFDLDVIYKLYKDVLINRTWMCRDEHNFPRLVEDDKENAYCHVYKILEDVCNYIKK